MIKKNNYIIKQGRSWSVKIRHKIQFALPESFKSQYYRYVVTAAFPLRGFMEKLPHFYRNKSFLSAQWETLDGKPARDSY